MPAILLAGCSSGPDAAGPAASTSPTAAATSEFSPQDITAQIKQAAGNHAGVIKSAVIDEPGRITIKTSIVDPRGAIGSPHAQQAIAICKAAQKSGDFTHVRVMENDGTHYVLAGGTYGDTCTEV